jgi:hypothetical protein
MGEKINVWRRNLKKTDHLEDLGLGGTAILTGF